MEVSLTNLPLLYSNSVDANVEKKIPHEEASIGDVASNGLLMALDAKSTQQAADLVESFKSIGSDPVSGLRFQDAFERHRILVELVSTSAANWMKSVKSLEQTNG